MIPIINMAKAMVEALAMRIDTLEKSDKAAAMRIEALEKDIASRFNVVDANVVKAKKELKPKKEKKAKPGPDDKPKNTDVMTEIARQWKALDLKDRDDWNAKAAKAKATSNHTHTLHPHPHDDDDGDDDDDDDN